MTDPPAGNPDAPGSTRVRTGLPGLPLGWRIAILAIAVIQFLFVHGAVWRRRFDWDRSILYSYATIPLLVFAALLVRKRLSWVLWFVHTIEIASAKFAITATTLLVVLIATRNEPVPKPALSNVVSTAPKPPPAQAPAPTVIDPAKTGTIAGRVSDASGSPLPGALAFVASGLENVVYPIPVAAVVVENDGTGFHPAVFAARTGQPIEAHSTDGQLHTLILEVRAGNWVRNIPLLASGALAHLPSGDMKGVFSMRCAVHGTREGKAYLALFPHPFFVIVGPGGNFNFANVPEAELKIGAFLADRNADAVAVRVTRGKQSDVAITIPSP